MEEEHHNEGEPTTAQKLSQTVEEVALNGLPEDTTKIKELFTSTPPEQIGYMLVNEAPPAIKRKRLFWRVTKSMFVRPDITLTQPNGEDEKLINTDFSQIVSDEKETLYPMHMRLKDLTGYLALPVREDKLTDNERVEWRAGTQDALRIIGKEIGTDDVLANKMAKAYKQNQLSVSRITLATGVVDFLASEYDLPEHVQENLASIQKDVLEPSRQKKSNDNKSQGESMIQGSKYSKMTIGEKLEVVEKTKKLVRDVANYFIEEANQ